MTVHHIQPDESGDVPRCGRAECVQFVLQDMTTDAGACTLESIHPLGHDLCLPRVRELVQLAARRCDGCARYWQMVGDGAGHCSDPGREGPRRNGDHCSHWEARK